MSTSRFVGLDSGLHSQTKHSSPSLIRNPLMHFLLQFRPEHITSAGYPVHVASDPSAGSVTSVSGAVEVVGTSGIASLQVATGVGFGS